ncbi:MAG TPA: hypothetical protein VN878_00670, partial [Usitatibacter sp.]|nr:hypothetical protein [Usitatibacter sp.]
MLRKLPSLGLQMLALAVALAAAPARALNHDLVVPAIAAGPFAVACSNLAQDPARIAQLGGAPIDYWEGRPSFGQSRYITQILTDLMSVVHFDAPIPDERRYYPQFAGGTVAFVAIVCHPTARANNDPDYALPGSQDLIPHMQLAGAPPKLISASEYLQTLGLPVNGVGIAPARLPLIAFSHGLSGSPISPGYLGAMVQLASQGYMVGAVFHADQRFSRVRVQDLADFWYLLRNFDLVVEMQLMRPLSIKAMIDQLLLDPGFAPGIDPDRIGGFGASLGGEAMMHLLGARITTTIGLGCHETVRDPRIKAAVGFVPYSGQSFLPAF